MNYDSCVDYTVTSNSSNSIITTSNITTIKIHVHSLLVPHLYLLN